jgi:hypothetical protein
VSECRAGDRVEGREPQTKVDAILFVSVKHFHHELWPTADGGAGVRHVQWMHPNGQIRTLLTAHSIVHATHITPRKMRGVQKGMRAGIKNEKADEASVVVASDTKQANHRYSDDTDVVRVLCSSFDRGGGGGRGRGGGQGNVQSGAAQSTSGHCHRPPTAAICYRYVTCYLQRQRHRWRHCPSPLHCSV